jgi:hypothetical protein
MVTSTQPSGLSDRWFARAAGGASFGPLSNPVVAALLGLLCALAAAALLFVGVPAGAAIVTVLAALTVGIASARAAMPGVSATRRAWVPAISVIAEGLIIVAAAFWARSIAQGPGPLAAGFLAAAGAILLTYARTRIVASAGMDLADGPWGIAARELRLVMLAVGIAIAQPYWALVVIAVLAHSAVLLHLARLRVLLRG